MTLEAMLEEIKALPVHQRKQLIRLIVDSLPDDGGVEPIPRRSITELRGLGKEIWKDIDAQSYVDSVRSEWEDRS